MVKHRVNNSAKDSKEIRKVNEFERRKKEAELINKIKRSVPFFKRNAKCNKKEFLRTITGYVKLFHSFKNTSVQPLPLKLDEVFQSLVRSDEINVFVCDGDLNMIFCSDSAFASLGYQWNDVYNKKLSSLVYGRDQDAFQRQINALKEDVIESMQTKDFNITCRMVMKKKSKIPEGHHLVRITGTIEYQRELVTQKVAIQKAKNTHLSIRYEDSPDHDSAIKIRGSIGLIKDPDFLTSQIDYILRNNSEYRLVMDPNGVILFACHRIVSNLGYTPEEVIGKSAYEFMYAADRQMSLYAHAGTLRDNAGVIVHRLKDVCARIVYLRSEGRLEKTDEYIFFHIVATLLSEEEGEKLLRQYEADLMPQCYNKTVQELQAKVDNVANEKLLQLENQLAAAKMVDGCDNKAANSSNDRLKASTSDISSSPCSSSMNSAFQGTLNESTENEFVEIASNAQSSPPGPSSQSSNLSTSSSSVPTLSPSTSVPSSSTQSPLSQSPSSQPCSSQSPPTYSLTPESQFTSDSSSMSQSMPSSASLSINYPVYATMNPYVPPTVMNSFPTNQRILQNQYYQFGTNQLCGMTSGQNAFVTNPKQMHIIITQCTISDQQTFFSAPVNNPQIIFQPTFPQYQTYNYNQEVQNIVGLDINQELQRVNVNDFVSSCDYEPELDLKQ
ncbi:endothelial PAS domain-containing protein 1 isoform X2 [Tetranychus urticae]|nr:endothelial PAS domain-containing protein 1 isoform X2 [Tetranychus urticae]XP_015789569.1 endothelial PAS domain-containing protein 1 isoform X2 [Tetranychus urticae]